MKRIGITAAEKQVICEALANCVDAIEETLDDSVGVVDDGKLGQDELFELCLLAHKRFVMLSVLNKLCNEHGD